MVALGAGGGSTVGGVRVLRATALMPVWVNLRICSAFGHGGFTSIFGIAVPCAMRPADCRFTLRTGSFRAVYSSSAWGELVAVERASPPIHPDPRENANVTREMR